jgi:glutaredoxin
VKEFLSQAGHAFTVLNVDEDLDAYDRLIALGYRTVPVTLVGDASVAGFDPAALAALLDEGASRTAPPDE